MKNNLTDHVQSIGKEEGWLGTLDECIRDNLNWYKEKGTDHGDLVIAEEAIKVKVILLE